jgi:hypothetical protein
MILSYPSGGHGPPRDLQAQRPERGGSPFLVVPRTFGVIQARVSPASSPVESVQPPAGFGSVMVCAYSYATFVGAGAGPDLG